MPAPALSTQAPRIFAPSFSAPGLTVGALFFAVSLLPSLLPRGAAIQGVVSGITFAIGYGLGAAGQSLWNYLQIPEPTGRARQWLMGGLVAAVTLVTARCVWSQVGWQNEVRSIFGMEPVAWTQWPTIAVVAVVVAALLLVVGRSLRTLFRAIQRPLTRRLPRRLGLVLGAVVGLLLVWSLVSGVLVNGFFSVANSMFSVSNDDTKPGVEQPDSELRSGGPESLVPWDSLGREGRRFVSGGPTAEELQAFSGQPALDPIRAYVGLESAATSQERADLLLDELKRTGAFDRQVLVVVVTTGSGFIDPNGIEPVEYINNGDTAIAGMQYSYLPSWISLLADQETVQEAAQTSFRTVHAYWSSLPETQRPQLYLYGLSLGSYGVESVLGSIEILNEPISGALMSGPPFVNPLHRELTEARQPGTSPAQPVYQDGRTVRFTTQQDALAQPDGPWGPTRLAYLQYGSDPVVFFSPDLAFTPPEWLEDGQRPADVSALMGWFPLVTMWQVGLDLPGAGGVPSGFGHLYSAEDNLEAWVAVMRPDGWAQARTDALAAELMPSD